MIEPHEFLPGISNYAEMMNRVKDAEEAEVISRQNKLIGRQVLDIIDNEEDHDDDNDNYDTYEDA